jgi:hypothetical protein
MLHDKERHRCQQRHREPREDRPSRCLEPVHLADDVAEDVSKREQECAAVGDDRKTPSEKFPPPNSMPFVAAMFETTSTTAKRARITSKWVEPREA